LQASVLHAPNCDAATVKKQQIDDVDESCIDSATVDWWRKSVDQEGEDNVRRVKNGYKVLLLLHILTFAERIGDKVVIFANSIPTLNYLEYVLALDWKECIPSLAAISPSSGTLGKWEKAKDYVRIDGTVAGAERGELVNQFEGNVGIKAFLMSKAGGIGINLVSFI
jgi:hypothetical protein